MSQNVWEDPRITAYVVGELQGAARVEFESELERSRELRSAVEQAHEIAREVTEVFKVGSNTALSSSRKAKVALAIRSSSGSTAHEKTPISDTSPKSRFRFASMLSLAATLLLMGSIGLAMLFNQPKGRRLAVSTESRATESRIAPASGAPASEAARPLAKEKVDNKKDSLGRLPPSHEIIPQSTAMATVASDKSEEMAAANGLARRNSIKSLGSNEIASPSARSKSDAKALSEMPVPGLAPMAPSPGSPVPTPSAPMSLAQGGSAADTSRFGSARARDLSSAVDERLADAPRGGIRGYAPPESRAESRTDSLLVEEELLKKEAPTRGKMPGGVGAGEGGDKFEPITDNPFLRVNEEPLSTFSIDVDTASYSKVRQFLMEANQLPRPDAVRIEELVNYFDYEYPGPQDDSAHPFAVDVQMAACPWNNKHRLARIALKGKELYGDRPRSNLVFLIDVSGSMNQPNKLPLVLRGMRMLLGQLDERDRIAIVVYAGAAGLVLDSTPADRREKIHEALDHLQAGGSTNGGQGIRLAYEVARDNFIKGGTNRIILCSDGDFNVGTTGTDELVRLVEKEAKENVFLTVLGFGIGNHNDSMLEQISNRGNGNYGFIDTPSEARKVLVRQLTGTLVTIAKDVKIQIEFNPKKISGYRLIGYENRLLAAQDFNDDKKDAGEIGAGHEVTALYELVPAGEEVTQAAPPVDALRYQSNIKPAEDSTSLEWLAVKLRYKQPEGDESALLEVPVKEAGDDFEKADDDFRFAAAVAGFGMQLRESPYKGNWEWADVIQTAEKSQGTDRWGLRGEFLELVQQAARFSQK